MEIFTLEIHGYIYHYPFGLTEMCIIQCTVINAKLALVIIRYMNQKHTHLCKGYNFGLLHLSMHHNVSQLLCPLVFAL